MVIHMEVIHNTHDSLFVLREITGWWSFLVVTLQGYRQTFVRFTDVSFSRNYVRSTERDCQIRYS